MKGAPKQKIKNLNFSYSKYLGGYSELGKERQGNLWLTDTEIGIGTLKPKRAVLPWSHVASIEISGDEVAKRKVGAVIVFGVLGGLAAKGAKNRTAITVHTKDNQTAYYLINKVSEIEARAKIMPLLHAVGVPISYQQNAQQVNSVSQPVTQVTDVAEQITKLAELKEQGILTAEEFSLKKKQLLGL